jgi:hypothetical protein
LRQFFSMYRAGADSDEMASAVVSVGEAMLAADGKGTRSTIETAIKDPMTVPFAKDRLDAILKAKDAAGGGATDKTKDSKGKK